MKTATYPDTRAPPTLVHTAMTDAASHLHFSDLVIRVEPADSGSRVTLTRLHHEGVSEWHFTAYAIPTPREAQTSLRAFRALHSPQPGDHLAFTFAPMDTATSSWRGPWHIDGSWGGGN